MATENVNAKLVTSKKLILKEGAESVIKIFFKTTYSVANSTLQNPGSAICKYPKERNRLL